MEALRVSVTEHFLALWSGANVDVGGNHSYSPIDGENWVRLNIIPFRTSNVEVGTHFQRTTGEILVQCFVPINTGERAISLMDDEVINIFQNQNFDNVSCFATSVLKIGASENWYQHNVATVFQCDVFS